MGQTELDIMQSADTTVVVLVPEAGDTIQTMKAGLFEIADIFAVNKADRPGADNLVNDLRNMLHLHTGQTWWEVPVLATQAVNDVGIDELFKQIEKHRQTMEETGELCKRRQEQRRREFLETVEHRVSNELLKLVERDKEMGRYMKMVESGEIDPYSAADEILRSGAVMTSWSQQLAGKQPKK